LHIAIHNVQLHEQLGFSGFQEGTNEIHPHGFFKIFALPKSSLPPTSPQWQIDF